jgi:hypothetical protein
MRLVMGHDNLHHLLDCLFQSFPTLIRVKIDAGILGLPQVNGIKITHLKRVCELARMPKKIGKNDKV